MKKREGCSQKYEKKKDKGKKERSRKTWGIGLKR